jgi:hypothetical protein
MIGRRAATVALPLAVVALGVGGWLVLGRDTPPSSAEARAVLDRYCIDCHNEIDLAGELRLDDKDAADVGHDPEIWERVVRKLKTGMMPPAGEPRPERAVLDELTAALEMRLDRAAENAPVAARTGLRRLNRTEYGNAVRDLLALDIDAATLLPLDDSSEGFDNMATALGVSPSLVQAYISAAMKISRRALGDRTAPRTQVAYTAPVDLAQDRNLAGMPLGTRGGLRIEHFFPLDAVYEIRIRSGFRGSARLDVTLDGEPISGPRDGPEGGQGRPSAPGGGAMRLFIPAGPHTLTATLIDTVRSSGVDAVYSEPPSTAGIQSIEIDGPFESTGVGDTPSRRRVLLCEPATAAEESPCAESIIATLATRAFRRPISREELPALMAFFDAGRNEGGFEAGIQQALARILVDPRFLYRIENEPAGLAVGTPFEIDEFALASRLSFFLWSSIPDDELLELAAAGRLREPAVLDAQVARMLADGKASALIDNFAAQWLFLRELESVTPDADGFDENLRQAMLEETNRLLGTVMRDDLSIVRLLDADFTFVDERLAEHYGIPDVHGSYFRRIELPLDSPRRGLLGHGSILTLTSVTNRTSPVIRGSWILENLLGSPAPTPPPNVETTLEGDDGTSVAGSVRERLEAHRSNPNCASCHAIMDPIGLTLENFDLIGAWRDDDGGHPIDATTIMADGTRLDGPSDLRAALLSRSDAFVTTAAEKLLTYALGRPVEYYDMPAIRAIVEAGAADDYRFSALILGIVHSEPFNWGVTG